MGTVEVEVRGPLTMNTDLQLSKTKRKKEAAEKCGKIETQENLSLKNNFSPLIVPNTHEEVKNTCNEMVTKAVSLGQSYVLLSKNDVPFPGEGWGLNLAWLSQKIEAFYFI